MAVGETGSGPFAERWNGSEWSLSSTPGPSNAGEVGLYGVSCASASSCMAVGHYKDETNGNRHKALAEAWNGSEWTIKTTPTPSEAPGGNDLYSVSCTSAGFCVAVGERVSKETMLGEIHFSSEERTLAEIWNGSEWTVKATTDPEGAKWSSLAAVSCSSSTACAAVGANYPGAKGEGNESVPVAERWE
jgi:hypothetical protein